MDFDEIVSLGYNCEVSFRIEDFVGKINAMPFSWSFVVDRNKFPDILKNVKSIFADGEILCEDRMIMCKQFELKFHPRYSVLPRVGEYTEEQYKDALAEVKERVGHLTEKFVNLCNSNKKTLFIMKVEDKGNDDNVQYIKNVFDELTKLYLSGKFEVAIAMQKDAVTPDIRALECDKIRVFPLKRFAPQKYTNIMGDVYGWYKLFYTMTGQKSHQYYWRIIVRRCKWLLSVVRRRLHV